MTISEDVANASPDRDVIEQLLGFYEGKEFTKNTYVDSLVLIARFLQKIDQRSGVSLRHKEYIYGDVLEMGLTTHSVDPVIEVASDPSCDLSEYVKILKEDENIDDRSLGYALAALARATYVPSTGNVKVRSRRLTARELQDELDSLSGELESAGMSVSTATQVIQTVKASLASSPQMGI